jgi:LysM repeat protein/uncharacterized protein YcbK (DUF882 family)
MSRSNHFGKWWLAATLAAALTHDIALASDVPVRKSEASYTVKSGDSLGTIAEQHGVSLDLLRKANGIENDAIRSGQVLLLPTFHEVKPGDVLGKIAERYGLKLSELYRLNGMNDKSVLRVGQKVVIASHQAPPAEPAPGIEPAAAPDVEYFEHKVRPNEVLSLIAERYAVPTKELSRINRLGKSSLIRPGQSLKIPITDDNAHLTRPKSWGKYAQRNFERGKVTLKAWSSEWTGRVLDEKGNVLPEAKQRIQSMLGSWETGKKVQVPLDPRLYRLIVLVSDEFGGRPIRVVSGYREKSHARNSKHRLGRALDFSIPGVPNDALVDFLITLPNTGVGYYPNSTHVHMDARASRMYWVDASGPGQAPRYVHKSNKGERAPVAVAAKLAKRRPAAKGSHAMLARLETRRR